MARNRQRAKQRKARQQGRPAQPEPAAVTAGDSDGDAVAAGPPAESKAAKSEAKAQPAAAPDKQKTANAKTAAAPRERGRVSGFFRSVWAELKRVQWPDRRQVSLLTGVVIGFVIVAGAYLGVIDMIAKQVVELIIF